MKTTTVLTIFLAAICCRSAAQAQSLVGERVTVIHWDAPIMLGQKTVRTTELGENFTVTKVSGDWIGVGVGYLKRSDVVPYDEAIDYFTRRIRADASADNYFDRGICWDYRDDLDKAISDYNAAILLDPEDARAYNYRGNAWRGNGDYDRAIGDFDAAIRLDPEDVLAYYDRGYAWYEKGDYDKAIRDYSDAIQLDPTFVYAYMERGNAWDDKGEHDTAIRDYDEAIRLDSEDALAYYNRGIAWMAKEEYDRAISDYSEAIRLDPEDPEAYGIRGDVWMAKGEYDRAISDYSAALEWSWWLGLDAYWLCDRGRAWMAKGEYDEAINDFDEAIEFDPEYADAYSDRAWLRATCPNAAYRDGEKAVSDATRACELSEYKDPNYLGTLAAAYAEAGDFEKAVEWQTKAVDMVSESERPGYQKSLDLYLAGQPYRQ